MHEHSPLLSVVGTVSGVAGGILTTELASLGHIALGAFIGAIIGFFTTMLLKKLFKQK